MEKHLFDTAEFFEIVLAHMIRDKIVFARAKELTMTSEDLLTTSKFGEPLYKVFADIAFAVNDSPISYELFGVHLKNKFDMREILEAQLDDASKLWAGVYAIELNSLYVANKLQDFVKYRRQSKARAEITDNEELYGKLNQIAGNFSKLELGVKATSINPFEKVYKKSIIEAIGTGFTTLDATIIGLGKGEYGLIIGYSGSGKTALATSFAHNIAIGGNKKVDYISLEEPVVDLANRFYAREFRIPYTELHRGDGYMMLDQVFPTMDPLRVANIPNLKLHDLRELTPISTDRIKDFLDKQYADTGRIPDVVFIDQMDYLEPCVLRDQAQKWEKYEQLTFDCDALSHHKIGGEHPFALWVLHQATGKMRKTFTAQEISAFKGIIKPADTALGIGREDMQTQDFNVFSLKARHSKPFEIGFHGELEFMTFTEMSSSLGSLTQAVYGNTAADDGLPKVSMQVDENVRPTDQPPPA